MTKLKYNAASDRMMIGNVELHAGYPVTVIQRDGMRGHDIAGLEVEPF